MSLLAQAIHTSADRAQELAASMPHALWRANALGSHTAGTLTSGYEALDHELPGQGWPTAALTELLWSQPACGEFRLLAPALATLGTQGQTLLLLAPPYSPYAPGLAQLGINLRHTILVEADKQADRLWACEQAIKSGCLGALVCWLPQARPDHLRRLQLAASASEALIFLCRPEAAQHESSPAPLRVLCRPAAAGQLNLHVLKRRGPASTTPIQISVKNTALLARALRLSSPTPSLPVPVQISAYVDRTSSAAIAAGSRVSALA